MIIVKQLATSIAWWVIRWQLLQLQEFQLALHFTPLFLGIPFGIHEASKKFGINPNELSLKLSAVPVSNEHRNSETEATHLRPMEALIEEDMLSFIWLSGQTQQYRDPLWATYSRLIWCDYVVSHCCDNMNSTYRFSMGKSPLCVPPSVSVMKCSGLSKDRLTCDGQFIDIVPVN